MPYVSKYIYLLQYFWLDIFLWKCTFLSVPISHIPISHHEGHEEGVLQNAEADKKGLI
jgi:hypothetical protein